jgi:tetratricopeptide (TPR) repeat protein
MSFFSGFFKGKKENDLKGSAAGAHSGSKTAAKNLSDSTYMAYVYTAKGLVYFLVSKSMQSVKDSNALKTFEKGLDFLGQAKPAEAVEAFRVVCNKFPESPEVRNNLGIALFFKYYLIEGENFEAIIDQFNRAVRINPKFVEAHLNIGNVYAKPNLKKHQDAIRDYGNAINLNPDCGEAYNNYGLILVEIGKTEEAIKEFLTALRCKPNYAETYYNLGDALRALGKKAPETLRKMENQLLEFLPKNDEDVIWVIALKTATQIKPKLLLPWFDLANYYRTIGKNDDYLRAYENYATAARSPFWKA